MTTSFVANPALKESAVSAATRRTKQRLTSRGATIASLVIAWRLLLSQTLGGMPRSRAPTRSRRVRDG